MKRPSLVLWERQERLAHFREAERLRRRGVRRISKSQRYVAPGPEITAPHRIELLGTSGRELVKFLRACARTVLDLRQPVRLNFRFTQSMTAPAMIVLFAEVDRLVTMAEFPKPVTIVDPRLRRPREVLKQIGLYEVTGDRCDLVPERRDVVYWKATKGKDQSGDKLAMLESIADQVNKDHASQLELSGVWRGVSEAVANSVEHAYKFPRQDAFQGLPETRWWMFTQVRDGVFTIAVCDLGCGYKATINQSVPEKFLIEVLATLGLGTNRDAAAVHAAMTYGRSGTKQSERGKGSRDAISVLAKHGNGDLTILSNTGWMKYEYEAGKETSATSGDLGIDIRGTIVWWKLYLRNEDHD